MAKYAVINNKTVINIISADSLEVAQEVTGNVCIEYTDEAPLQISWYWDDTANNYIMPAPYTSWIYNYELKTWQAPTPMPEAEDGKFYNWNEETISWDLLNIDV
jgi:hypothetical protein